MAVGSVPRTILITGANRGLGFELVKQLLSATQPPEMLFAAFRGGKESGKGKELESLLESNHNLHLVSLDVTSDESIAEAGHHVQETLKGQGLNLLVNNAGFSAKEQTLDAVTSEVLRDTFAINVSGPMMVTKAFLPLLKKAAADSASEQMGWRKSMVINMSSIMGSIAKTTSPKYHAYGASKAALNHFSKKLGVEVNSDGILVVSIHPGWVKTDMGGPGGQLTPDESIRSLLTTLSTFDKDHQGGYFTHDGQPLPW